MKYHQHIEDGEDNFTDWFAPKMDGWKMACCDCGLVHDVEFRVVDGEVQMRAKRNARSTAARRRNTAQQ